VNKSPYPFHDFMRAKDNLLRALLEHQEPFALLTGETGTGKTALLRELKAELDRARYRVLYFAQARKLGAAGLIQVLAESLRVRTSLYHSVSFERCLRTLCEEPHPLMLLLDEGHDLPEETFAEARALAESNLEGTCRVHVLLVSLPKLRAELRAHPALWRRIAVRVELTGLLFEELPAFLDHHFPHEHRQRLCEQGLATVFERAKGVPGLLLPMVRAILDQNATEGTIDPLYVEDTLERWELA